MLWAVIGILTGVIIGLSLKVTIPIDYVKYTAVVILVMLDSIFGAVKVELSKDKFSTEIFTTGLLVNVFLALIITLLGERLGLDLYLAVTVVFTLRIFSNLSIVRRAILEIINKNRNS